MQKFKINTEVCFGNDSLSELGAIEAKNAVIFTDAFLCKSGTADKIAGYMKNCSNIKIYSDIKPDPPIELIAEALDFLLKADADVVVALGGGSSIDAAKSTVLIARKQTGKKLPLIAVPTTSGTGSEVTSFAVITDKTAGVKYPLVSDSLLPEKAILSGELVMSVPPQITADTGFDVLTHALEAYISTQANDFSDAMAEKALEIAFEYLPEAYKNGNNEIAREKMHTASCLAGMAFNSVSLGVNHGIAHSLGAHFHIPHGRANGMLLPYVMWYNAGLDKNVDERTAARLAKIAKLIGLPAFNAKAGTQNLVNKLKQMQKEMKIPLTLKDAGVDKKAFEEAKEHIIKSALNDACTVTNPRKLEPHDIDAILANIAKF